MNALRSILVAFFLVSTAAYSMQAPDDRPHIERLLRGFGITPQPEDFVQDEHQCVAGNHRPGCAGVCNRTIVLQCDAATKQPFGMARYSTSYANVGTTTTVHRLAVDPTYAYQNTLTYDLLNQIAYHARTQGSTRLRVPVGADQLHVGVFLYGAGWQLKKAEPLFTLPSEEDSIDSVDAAATLLQTPGDYEYEWDLNTPDDILAKQEAEQGKVVERLAQQLGESERVARGH